MLNTMFTVIALIAVAASFGFAYYAHLCARAAEDDADELASGLRKLVTVREDIEMLSKRLDRVSGRVYAQARRAPADDDFTPAHLVVAPGSPDLDPELAAELALQAAPAVAPGKRN